MIQDALHRVILLQGTGRWHRAARVGLDAYMDRARACLTVGRQAGGSGACECERARTRVANEGARRLRPTLCGLARLCHGKEAACAGAAACTHYIGHHVPRGPQRRDRWAGVCMLYTPVRTGGGGGILYGELNSEFGLKIPLRQAHKHQPIDQVALEVLSVLPKQPPLAHGEQLHVQILKQQTPLRAGRGTPSRYAGTSAMPRSPSQATTCCWSHSVSPAGSVTASAPT
jgi:hypothetical protein